ncbi:hypothetical protein MJG53_020639 [Ovis ammon polii x Ovis aries]|uniref:Uncharacterized protein n=1 Tax=Ovis ammon polii x Ovis aries TaxID=2918886 RepID=A0ACB9V6Z1_9CETA|nr:hypothetical protein MJG53_020639 [Ovis ammon polii x Ovis aries]
MIEQLTQVHNSTVQISMERLCSYLPGNVKRVTWLWLLTSLCFTLFPSRFRADMNADVVCHTLKFCKQDPGQPLCHLYPLPKVTELTLPMCALHFQTLRGFHWRGRDCNDSNKMAYPGSELLECINNANKLCPLGSQPRGVILLGDSAGAHFHIPPDWITASQMSLVSNFGSNHPQCAGLCVCFPLALYKCNASSKQVIKENSIYLRLRKRNRCNHRDYQNISKNGILSRNQLLDYPAIVIYAMIGNDVCSGHIDPLPEMTTPEKLYSKVTQTLQYLNSHLPNGSHVILYGLPDGRFLWDHLHDRYHPLVFSCSQVSPCRSWMSSNKTLRTLTSERAEQLSKTLKKIATSQKFKNFDLFYLDFDFQEITEEWQKKGGQPWQLIEPVDGFHPNEVRAVT